ncbi:MAG: mitofilin family membrane protein [Rhodobacter sp.]|nr:mitofilin family membrane protein [Rhodobacter sp.]
MAKSRRSKAKGTDRTPEDGGNTDESQVVETPDQAAEGDTGAEAPPDATEQVNAEAEAPEDAAEPLHEGAGTPTDLAEQTDIDASGTDEPWSPSEAYDEDLGGAPEASDPNLQDDTAAEGEPVDLTTEDQDIDASADELADGSEAPEAVGEVYSEQESDAAVAAEAASEPTAPTPVPAAPPAPRSRSPFPMILGGIVAAVIGAAALYISADRGWIVLGSPETAEMRADMEVQAARITELEAALKGAAAEIVALQGAQPDLSPVTGALDAVQNSVADVTGSVTEVAGQVAALAARLDDTDARLGEVETQPIPEAELPAEVVAAFERQMDDMQASLDDRFAGIQDALGGEVAAIETALTDKLSEIEAAQAAAADAEAAAKAAAQAAEARAALAEVEVALDTGGGFAEALAALSETTGDAAPAALADHAEEGIATLQALKDGFPDAARAALSVSIAPDPEAGTSGRLGAFLRTQLGVRSLEPRAGDDPDAVLSRAEAALGGGDLAGAMELIAALPEDGRAAFEDWIRQAEIRMAALAAAGAISDQIIAD